MSEVIYRRTYMREWRQKRGLSLRKLADRLESSPGGEPLISHAQLGRIELGEQPYSQPIIEAIAEALNCSVTDLIEVNPSKDGEVIDIFRRIPPEKREQVIDYLKFLARDGTSG